MAFSSQIIRKVKEKAAFRCCRCQEIGIEVHHIIPQKYKGPDTFKNAAPLCPNCHTSFGDNPIKRKEITQMRDWWYKIVDEQYTPKASNIQLLNDINSKVEALTNNQDKALDDLKETLKNVAVDTIEKMTAGTARITASNIANVTYIPPPTNQYEKSGITEIYDSPYTLTGLNTYKRVKCPKCGTLGQINYNYNYSSLTSLTNMPKHYKCETCGTEFEDIS